VQVNNYLTVDTSREKMCSTPSYLALKKQLMDRLLNEKLSPNLFLQLRGLDEDWIKWAECSSDITDVVHIGIGGSIVGMKALAALLEEVCPSPTRRLHFVSSLDEREIKDALRGLNPHTTLTYVVSKTMSSLEPLANLTTALKFYSNDWNRIRAVTAYPLRASELGFLAHNIQSFPQWVSGRFSVWGACSSSLVTVYGSAPFISFLESARAFDQDWLGQGSAFESSCQLALLDAVKNTSGCLLKLIGVYGYRLRELPDYFMQLHMESLGKDYQAEGGRLSNPAANWVLSMVGTELQHSVSQMVMQGGKDISVDWVVVSTQCDLMASAIAQSEALYQGYENSDFRKSIQGGRGSTLIVLNDLSLECLGSLMALYEYKIFIQGEYSRVNVFDQWGVERAKNILSTMKAK
jgi:glucose-6-phosphate isomerase